MLRSRAILLVTASDDLGEVDRFVACVAVSRTPKEFNRTAILSCQEEDMHTDVQGTTGYTSLAIATWRSSDPGLIRAPRFQQVRTQELRAVESYM